MLELVSEAWLLFLFVSDVLFLSTFRKKTQASKKWPWTEHLLPQSGMREPTSPSVQILRDPAWVASSDFFCAEYWVSNSNKPPKRISGGTRELRALLHSRKEEIPHAPASEMAEGLFWCGWLPCIHLAGHSIAGTSVVSHSVFEGHEASWPSVIVWDHPASCTQ